MHQAEQNKIPKNQRVESKYLEVKKKDDIKKMYLAEKEKRQMCIDLTTL